MRNIGDTFHFKGYVWEIEDKWQGGYALGRTTKNNKYELNGWVTENYQIFDNNPNKPEQIKDQDLEFATSVETLGSVYIIVNQRRTTNESTMESTALC